MEFGVEGVSLEVRGSFDVADFDVDEEVTGDGAAADKDGEVVFGAVGKGEGGLESLVAEGEREFDTVADLLVAVGGANEFSHVVFSGEGFSGVERGGGGEKFEGERAVRLHVNVGGPNTRGVGAGVDFGGDVFDVSDFDVFGGADDGFVVHIFLLYHKLFS